MEIFLWVLEGRRFIYFLDVGLTREGRYLFYFKTLKRSLLFHHIHPRLSHVSFVHPMRTALAPA